MMLCFIIIVGIVTMYGGFCCIVDDIRKENRSINV